MFTYICTKGHVAPAPEFGDLNGCHALEPVSYGGTVRGFAPCGCPIVKVPADDGIQAAYDVGGCEAVLALLRARIGTPALVAVYDRLGGVIA